MKRNVHDQDGAFASIIQRPRKLRKECFVARPTDSTCHAASRSAVTRFRQRMNAGAGVSLVKSTCIVDRIAKELRRTEGESDILTRMVERYHERRAKGDESGATEDEMMYEYYVRNVVTALLNEKSHFIDRVRNLPNESLKPDPWTIDVLHFNSYEHGYRSDVKSVLRPCASPDCLSRYVQGGGEESPTLAECMNVDAMKVVIGGGSLEDVGASNHYGRPYCILCLISNVYSRCMDPLGSRTMDLCEYATSFSFRIVDLNPDYEVKCQFTMAESGVQLTYHYLNVDGVIDLLRWVKDNPSDPYRIDFSVLMKKAD